MFTSAPSAPARAGAAVVALSFVLLVAGCSRGPDKPAADAAPPVLIVVPEDLRSVQTSLQASGPVITGSLQPERRADLRAEIGAVVLQVLRESGEPVRSGEVLVRLDDSTIRETLASADGAVRAAQQSLDQGRRQLERLRSLQAQGMMSLQALEDAELRTNLAQSELVAARARASTARQQLDRTVVRAPFDGVVSERRVFAGDTVQVGRELLKVIDPGTLRLEGLISADRMHEVRAGQTVRFRVNGFPDVEFVGRVARIDATANATTRQVAVRVDFDDRVAAPRVAGLFAEGRIETGAAEVLTLPEASVLRSGDNAEVWRVEGEQLVRVAVRLGERDARRGEFPVLAGLNAGDRILRNPTSNLRDGQRIELRDPEAPRLPTDPAALAGKPSQSGVNGVPSAASGR
jgi:membrane fusion protein, multidrug efflux system